MTKTKSEKKPDTKSADKSKLENLVEESKKKGFVTYDEIGKALPEESFKSPEEIESAMSNFAEAGIDILEDDEDIDIDINVDEKIRVKTSVTETEEETEKAEIDTEIGTTDAPVRLYLRDMGGVELLSRDGEIEIAKRIEQGKNMMITSLCDSPLSMKLLF